MTDKKEFKSSVLFDKNGVKVKHITGVKENGDHYDFKQLILERRRFNKETKEQVLYEVKLFKAEAEALQEALSVLNKK